MPLLNFDPSNRRCVKGQGNESQRNNHVKQTFQIYRCYYIETPFALGGVQPSAIMISRIFILVPSCVYAASTPWLGKIELTHNPSYNYHSHYLRSLARYNIASSLPHANNPILPIDSNVSAPISTAEASDGFYLTQITIGTGVPPQTFNADFDTGSADVWALSTLLTNDSRGTHNLYDHTHSPSAVLLPGQTWNDAFQGTTEIGGIVFSDTLNLGGIVIPNQAIQAATQAIPALIDGSRDAFVGLALGRNGITPGQFPSVIDNFVHSSAQEPVFTALLTRVTEAPGFWTFGYINNTLSAPGIQYNPIVTIDPNAPGQWEVKSEYAILNGIPIARKGNTAVVDTGTPGILLEGSIVEDIYSFLHGQFDAAAAGWVFPANLTEFPTLTLPAGTTNVTLTASDFASFTSSPGMFFGTIQSRGDSKVDVFGHPWFNNIYAVFDLGITGPEIVRFGIVPRTS